MCDICYMYDLFYYDTFDFILSLCVWLCVFYVFCDCNHVLFIGILSVFYLYVKNLFVFFSLLFYVCINVSFCFGVICMFLCVV